MSFNVDRISERKIQEAIDDGAFDNLPGKGRPLILDDDPLTPPHLRLPNRIMKNAGVLPDWIDLAREIRAAQAECARAFDRFGKEYSRRSAGARASDADAPSFAAWYARTRESYFRGLKRVNTDILKYNLMAPSAAEPLIPYRLEEEQERVARAYPPPSHVPQVPKLPDAPHRTNLRDTVVSLYRAKVEREKNR
jgi:DnaJ family protein C protein 28